MEFYIKSYLKSAPLNYTHQLIEMIALFRQALYELKENNISLDKRQAKYEHDFYLKKNYPIYVAVNDNDDLIGYIVIKDVDEIVWAESLYVHPQYRRSGVAQALFKKAEMISKNYDQQTVYVWVHPNNDKMIRFLAKQGYDVLNLIEIRKKRENENSDVSIQVGDHEFKF